MSIHSQSPEDLRAIERRISELRFFTVRRNQLERLRQRTLWLAGRDPNSSALADDPDVSEPHADSDTAAAAEKQQLETLGLQSLSDSSTPVRPRSSLFGTVPTGAARRRRSRPRSSQPARPGSEAPASPTRIQCGAAIESDDELETDREGLGAWGRDMSAPLAAPALRASESDIPSADMLRLLHANSTGGGGQSAHSTSGGDGAQNATMASANASEAAGCCNNDELHDADASAHTHDDSRFVHTSDAIPHYRTVISDGLIKEVKYFMVERYYGPSSSEAASNYTQQSTPSQPLRAASTAPHAPIGVSLQSSTLVSSSH